MSTSEIRACSLKPSQQVDPKISENSSRSPLGSGPQQVDTIFQERVLINDTPQTPTQSESYQFPFSNMGDDDFEKFLSDDVKEAHYTQKKIEKLLNKAKEILSIDEYGNPQKHEIQLDRFRSFLSKYPFIAPIFNNYEFSIVDIRFKLFVINQETDITSFLYQILIQTCREYLLKKYPYSGNNRRSYNVNRQMPRVDLMPNFAIHLTCSKEIAYIELISFLKINGKSIDLPNITTSPNNLATEISWLNADVVNEAKCIGFYPNSTCDIFLQYSSARYIASCLLGDRLDEASYAIKQVWHHSMQEDYHSVEDYIKAKANDPDHQIIWMFVDEILERENDKKSLERFQICRWTDQQLIDGMRGKKYEFTISCKKTSGMTELTILSEKDSLDSSMDEAVTLQKLRNRLKAKLTKINPDSPPEVNGRRYTVTVEATDRTINKILIWFKEITRGSFGYKKVSQSNHEFECLIQ